MGCLERVGASSDGTRFRVPAAADGYPDRVSEQTEQDPPKETTRLPRGRQAAKPQPDEKIRKRTGADLQNGWLGRHGTLYLTDDRLVFVPTVLDTVLLAKRREISLDTLREIERWPKSPGDIPRGARRPRMRLHAPECTYEFMVGDLDAWIDALEKVYSIRHKQGREHMPRVTRDGHENLLLADE